MSQPPSPYERSYSFTDNSTNNPTSQQPGQKIDQELNAARTAINATQSRLGEVQADDGKVRTSALNLPAIAEAVEPLLTSAPVTAVNAAGSTQVNLVNAAGTTQVGNVNAAGTASIAAITAATNTATVTQILNAKNSAQASADAALISQNLAATSAGYSQTNYELSYNARIDAIAASVSAGNYAVDAANYSASANTEANNAINAASLANNYKNDANESKLAALEAKADAEAAADIASNAVSNVASAAADAAAAAASASAASGYADAAYYSAAAAASSAATINPANFAAAVHTHAQSDVTGLVSALAGKAASSHTHPVGDITGLSTALTGYATLNGSTFTGKVNTVAATTGSAGFRVNPSAATPTSSLQGDVWFDSNLAKLRVAAFNGSNHTIASESWVTSQGYVGTGYLFSNGYLKFGDTGTHAFTYASKKDYSSNPVQTIVGGYGNGYTYEATATLSSVSYDGWSLNFNGSYGGGYSYYSDSGSKTHYITYDTSFDLSNIISGISGLSIPGFSFSYSDDSMGPYYSTLTSVYGFSYPTIAVTNSDRFIFDLSARMQEMAFSGSVAAQNTLFFDGSNVVWGKPWIYEGYVTSSALSGYATTASVALKANTASPTFTGKVTTAASVSGSAGFRLPHGVAPSGPVGGDLWSTSSGLFVYLNTATRTVAMREVANTYTAGSKQTMSHSASSSGCHVAPVATALTSPVNGDVWHDSTTGMPQIFGRVNGNTAAMTAVRAFVNFNGTGTVAIRSGFNVSSITDNGAADYTVNFTTAISDANYTPLISSNWNIGSNGAWAGTLGQHPTVAPTTTALRLQQTAIGDFTYCSVAILR